MSKTHRVGPGDWIGAIAAAHGWAHWVQLWSHAVNEPLRQKRRSPDLLMVGDEVTIPELDDAGVEIPAGTRAVFVVHGFTDKVRIRVTGIAAFVTLIGPIDFELSVGEHVVTGILTEDGQTIEAPLDPSATKAVLELMGGRRFEHAIGGLGPVDEGKGAHARLVNLGFGDDALAADSVNDAGLEGVVDPLTKVVRRFQRAIGLDVTGELDDATKRAIAKTYGG